MLATGGLEVGEAIATPDRSRYSVRDCGDVQHIDGMYQCSLVIMPFIHTRWSLCDVRKNLTGFKSSLGRRLLRSLSESGDGGSFSSLGEVRKG